MEQSEVLELLQDKDQEADFRAMYQIIVDVRTERGGYGEFDQRIALAALCRISWPGKLSTYSKVVRLVQGKFKGIAENAYLAHQFRQGLSPRLIRAQSQRDIRFGSRDDLYPGDLPHRAKMYRKVRPGVLRAQG